MWKGDSIYMHLEKHGPIKDSQHDIVWEGLRLTNSITFFERVTKMIDESRAVNGAYMYVSKTFDKVPHGRQNQKI